MPTGEQIFLKGARDLANLHYEHYLYTFPEDVFFDNTDEMEDAIGVPLYGFIHDELFRYGIVDEDERGEFRIGPKMRKRIKSYLVKHPIPVSPAPPQSFKVRLMKARQEFGREELVKTAKEMNFNILSDRPDGAMMWSRELGVLAVAGSSWCYLYKTGQSFRMDINFPILAYFQLGGRDIPTQFRKAINGDLQLAADKLSQRRKAFMIRKKRRQDKVSYIRNINAKRSDQN